jgi:hypothetical protein
MKQQNGWTPMTLLPSVRILSKSILLKNQLTISRTTEFDRLTQFFGSIKPIATNRELIRIGGEYDGGYLVPNDLDNIEICFSPGVSEIADFESDLASRGIKCFLADYSVEAPPIQNDLFHFEKKFLGAAENSTFMTLDNWVKKHAANQTELILQMDIEGSEYSVVFDTPLETLRKFRIMVIEFHSLDGLCNKFGFELISLTFTKLLKEFEIVHIHPNNYRNTVVYGKYEIPIDMEFTFLRKDRISSRSSTIAFPHPLDRKNDRRGDELSLPACWFE